MKAESFVATLGVVAVAILIIALVGGGIWLIGSHNPEVPAGYVGYQTQGAIFGSAKFYGTLKGPSSPGMTWKLHSFPVSITPYTYTEEFIGSDAVLSKDSLNIEFKVHIVFRIKEDSVKEFVERYSTIDPNGKTQDAEKVVKDAYSNYVKEPLRTYSRAEVQRLDGLKIKENFLEIGDKINEKVQELTKNTPFEVKSVVVGNIQYPKVVANAVAENLAATQRLEQEKKDKERRIVQAEGIAEAMKIINERLTAQYLQHEAIEAQKLSVGSPNHSVIYIPTGPLGVPIVGTMDVLPKKDK